VPPEQNSCSSQPPLAGRHTVPSGAVLDRQLSSLPRQKTSTRQFDTDPVAHLCEPAGERCQQKKKKKKKKKKKIIFSGATHSGEIDIEKHRNIDHSCIRAQQL
jgi:hypothetical protein